MNQNKQNNNQNKIKSVSNNNENLNNLSNKDNKDKNSNSKKIIDEKREPEQITDEEKELIEAFETFDENKTGFVSESELKHAMMTLGDKLTEEEADEMIEEAKPDKNGLINYREFVKILLK